MPKAAKDENKPKRARSAYMYFVQETRAQVTKENPDLDFGGVGRELGSRWASLDDGAKKKYQKMADEDKKRYQEEMKNYSPPPAEEKKKRSSRGKKAKA